MQTLLSYNLGTPGFLASDHIILPKYMIDQIQGVLLERGLIMALYLHSTSFNALPRYALLECQPNKQIT